MAIKDPVSGDEVATTAVTRAASDGSAILVDDIISTGGTLEAAVSAIEESWSPESLQIAVTHPVLVDDAPDRVRDLKPVRVVVSDTIGHDSLPSPFEVVGVAGILARAIRSRSGFALERA